MSLILAAALLLPHPSCRRTFTPPMSRRAIYRAYRGQRRIRPADRQNLSRYIRCQRQAGSRQTLHRLWARIIRRRAQAQAQARAQAWVGPVTASWFDDTGTTACGTHATYGFATLLPYPCGTQITFQGPAGTITGTLEDHGPYIPGRTFDLTPALKDALGCPDLCSVRYQP